MEHHQIGLCLPEVFWAVANWGHCLHNNEPQLIKQINTNAICILTSHITTTFYKFPVVAIWDFEYLVSSAATRWHGP